MRCSVALIPYSIRKDMHNLRRRESSFKQCETESWNRHGPCCKDDRTNRRSMHGPCRKDDVAPFEALWFAGKVCELPVRGPGFFRVLGSGGLVLSFSGVRPGVPGLSFSSCTLSFKALGFGV